MASNTICTNNIAFLMVAAYRTWLKEHRRLVDDTERSAAVLYRLEEELARKHPYDEQAEAAVRKAIAKLDDFEALSRVAVANGPTGTSTGAGRRRFSWSARSYSPKKQARF
jgi:hypothetical protein